MKKSFPTPYGNDQQQQPVIDKADAVAAAAAADYDSSDDSIPNEVTTVVLKTLYTLLTPALLREKLHRIKHCLLKTTWHLKLQSH